MQKVRLLFHVTHVGKRAFSRVHTSTERTSLLLPMWSKLQRFFQRTPVFCSRETRDTRVFTFVHILSALLLEGVPKFVLTTTFIGSERESTSNLGN